VDESLSRLGGLDALRGVLLLALGRQFALLDGKASGPIPSAGLRSRYTRHALDASLFSD